MRRALGSRWFVATIKVSWQAGTPFFLFPGAYFENVYRLLISKLYPKVRPMRQKCNYFGPEVEETWMLQSHRFFYFWSFWLLINKLKSVMASHLHR